MITTITVNQKGQVTIPAFMRDSLGINPKSTLTIMQDDNGLTLRPTEDFFSLRGSVKTKKTYKKSEARKQFIQSLSSRKK